MSEIKTFENKKKFNEYYEENKEEIDNLKTKELNEKYKIEGFKIIRNKGKIAFRKIKETKTKTESSNDEEEVKNFVNKVVENINSDELKKQIKEFDDMFDYLKEINKKVDDMLDLVKEIKEGLKN